MKRLFSFCLFQAAVLVLNAQSHNEIIVRSAYHEAPSKINDLIHTKLSVRFDAKEPRMMGKAWLTFAPHFYKVDTLVLDARQMEISKVQLLTGNSAKEVSYKYDGWTLVIPLGKSFVAKEQYTVYIDYVAEPGKASKSGPHGLYFINANKDGKETRQIWTDGEPGYTSFWCPTIDAPNQKSTLEISMTVPADNITVSNGLLLSQKKNNDGTHTDNWKMTMPLSPYLFFMATGDFAIVKDKHPVIPVSYYVDKEYENVAKRIFGNTPAMMNLFGKLLGVPYPWPKYSQVTLHNFTSTAMENTSITAHSDAAQQDARELVDQNRWENNIAHELFHQWFGDYITCESWSNLAINEGFAVYGTYLWREHAYGLDAADEGNYNDLQTYLRNKENETKELIRFHYNKPEDLFDDVSYQKGGCIIHMLRKYIGDSAFFQSLHLFLTRYKFQAVEAHHLRLVMEEVTGKDLNWFFNQWFFGNGHPVVDISYSYNETAGKMNVIIKQTQKNVFRFPLAIDVYNGPAKIRYNVWVQNETDSFTFSCIKMPDLVNVDAEKIMLWEKKDHKSTDALIHQYHFAGNYVDRIEAVSALMQTLDKPSSIVFLKTAVQDRYPVIRQYIAQQLLRGWNNRSDSLKKMFEPIIQLLSTDKSPLVKAKAITLLSFYHNPAYRDLFIKGAADSSYSVAGASLTALAEIDSSAALSRAKVLMNNVAKRDLSVAILTVLMTYGNDEQYEYIVTEYNKMPFTGYKISATAPLIKYLGRITDLPRFSRAFNLIISLRNDLPEQLKNRLDDPLRELLVIKRANHLQEQANMIAAQLK